MLFVKSKSNWSIVATLTIADAAEITHSLTENCIFNNKIF